MAAKIPEEYFSCGGGWGGGCYEKAMLGSSAQSPEPGRSASITSGCGKQQGFFPLGRDGSPRDIGAVLKGQYTKFHSQALILEGCWSGLEWHEESLGSVVLGRELMRQAPAFLH